jgi:hypothetical protein
MRRSRTRFLIQRFLRVSVAERVIVIIHLCLFFLIRIFTIFTCRRVNPIVYTLADEAKLKAIAVKGEELFSSETKAWWHDAKALKKAADEFSQSCGFALEQHGSSLRCSLAQHSKAQKNKLDKKKKDTTPSRERNRATNRCGCGFVIKFSVVGLQSRKKSPEKYGHDCPTTAVRVTQCKFLHSNGCLPSRHQLVVQKKAKGRYTTEHLTAANLAPIIAFSRHGYLAAPALRSMLKDLLPEGVSVDSKIIHNMRCKVKRIRKHEDDNPDSMHHPVEGPEDFLLKDKLPLDGTLLRIDSFICFIPLCSLLSADLPADFIGDSSRMIRELLREALQEGNDTMHIKRLLESMHQADPGFTYFVALDSEGRECGFMWMTPVMRRMFELYGDVLFLDAMKRQLNSVNWPYFSIVLLDGFKKVVLAAEGIACVERIATYIWLVKGALSMAPRRKKESIKVIFADGLMGDRLLTELEIEDTCKLCLDAYHILEVDCPKQFGSRLWSRLKVEFDKLVRSKNDAEYDHAIDVCRQNVENTGNQAHVTYLENEIHNHRHKFVYYLVASYEGTCSWLS